MAVTLEASYARCRALNRRHGTTYYWATNVLAAHQRPHVHALYGFCRHADDIVDDLGDVPVAERRAALTALGDRLFGGLAAGDSDDPVLKAVVHTVRVHDIDPDLFRRFLRSMHMDLDRVDYATWPDLLGYMDGSAAVVGEMVLPVLAPTSAAARAPARDLGLAFQLTNFLRDVDEDLGRGRVYLPQEDLACFGADPHERRASPPWRALMRFEVARCRELYASADRGLDQLPPVSAGCVAAARRLYSAILDRIEAADYDVFNGRVRVPTWRKVVAVTPLVARRVSSSIASRGR